MTPYALLSDIHCHAWSAFSTVDPDGVNSRLRIILNELMRAARLLKVRKGDTMVLAGDLFHVRGSVKPSVMNPVFETFREISRMGINVYSIAGNHDLEGSDADELGNAMQALGSIGAFYPITEPTKVDTGAHRIFLLPWYSKLDALRHQLKNFDGAKDHDSIIHAPVNGVVKGIPDIGLTPDELADFGFNRVFAGHFHNHVAFPRRVWSIGATTHQTWNDPGSLAGFMMVYPDRVEHIPTEAPQFVDLTKPEHISPTVVKCNYVRLKLTEVSEADIKAYRDELESMGALAVSIIATKKTEATRESKIKSGTSLEESVAIFIDKDAAYSDKTALQAEAASILMEVRSK
jgi:DNA repair exonuclease SbcCD nuclease subunit